MLTDSFLKRNKDYVCIETTFEMKYKDKDEIKEVMNDRKIEEYLLSH